RRSGRQQTRAHRDSTRTAGRITKSSAEGRGDAVIKPRPPQLRHRKAPPSSAVPIRATAGKMGGGPEQSDQSAGRGAVMRRCMLKSKIHRACVTDADVNYEGSLTLD